MCVCVCVFCFLSCDRLLAARLFTQRCGDPANGQQDAANGLVGSARRFHAVGFLFVRRPLPLSLFVVVHVDVLGLPGALARVYFAVGWSPSQHSYVLLSKDAVDQLAR